MLSYILLGLALFIVTFLIMVMAKSDDFKISRSFVIKAPADIIFDHINSQHKFNSWNPWIKADPDAEVEYDGPESGVGASYSWDGKRTGEGKSTITSSIPNKKIVFQLDFYKPMSETHTAEFILNPVEDGIEVEWSMWGRRKFATKRSYFPRG